MVKYYFQSLNGELAFVHAGDKEGLKEKVIKELDGDKEQAANNIRQSISEAEKQVAILEKALQEPQTEIGKLEIESKLANYRLGIAKANEELSKVSQTQEKDLIFFELTPIEL